MASGYKYKIIEIEGLDHNCKYTYTVTDEDVAEIVEAAIIYMYFGPKADGWSHYGALDISISGKDINVTTTVTSGAYFYYKKITFLIVYK